MGTKRRDGLPSVWVTWITGLLASEDQCGWAPWFKSRFWYAKSPDSTFDSVKWTADHGDLVRRRAEELRRDGWSVSLEAANKFTVTGKTATLTGIPDIVATRDKEILIVDAKSGQPRNAHWWQVAIYVRFWRSLNSVPDDWIIRGEVHYDKSLPVYLDEADLITTGAKSRIGELIASLGSDTEPVKSPSCKECRFCNITVTDCPARRDAELEANTEEF